MASGQTKHYGLNQWQAGDQVLREEFDTDNEKIDAALAALAAMPGLVLGSYTGDGAGSQRIKLGFTPRAVFVCASYGAVFYHYSSSDYYFGGLALPGKPVTAIDGSPTVLEIVEGGFLARYASPGGNDYIRANVNGTVYHYAALK